MIFSKRFLTIFLLLSMTSVFFYYTINIFFGNYSFSEIRRLSMDLENLKNSNDVLENENKILLDNLNESDKNKETSYE